MAGNDVQYQDNTALASESLLRVLARQLNREWKFLGRQLGLSEIFLNHNEQDYKGDSQEISYQTLLRWKQTYGSRSTIGCLAKALHRVGRTDLAVFVMQQGDQDGPVETSEEPAVEGCYEIVIAREPTKEIEPVLHACVCGMKSFKEIKSHNDETVVILLCNFCPAQWFSTTESEKLHIVWENKKFLYKVPREMDLSKLKHEQVKDVNELQRGDHIVFRRAQIYDHHAIFLHKSENEKEKIKLIHWSGPPVLIKCEDILFPKGGVRRVQYPESDPAYVVVARAYAMLDDSNQKYDLANNNCESLATFCKTGKAFSTQGEAVGDVLPLFSKVVKKIKYFKS